MHTLQLCAARFCAALILVAIITPTLAATPPAVRVIDGDTIAINGTRHRLIGTDAPEAKQLCQRADNTRWPCGQAATTALRQKIGNSPVICVGDKKGVYKRTLSTCYANGINLNAWLVKNGHAVAYKNDKRFTPEQTHAKTHRLGIWSGSFVLPWEWRRGERLP
jgi:endonuclease YncB( thermonuclease family)